MRNLLIGLLMLFAACGCSVVSTKSDTEYQYHTDSILTYDQAQRLNSSFDSITPFDSIYRESGLYNKRGDFDFTGKKVAFIYIGTHVPASEYFKQEPATPLRRGYLYILTTDEKVETGGYDAVIMYYGKRILSRKSVINKLKKQ